MTQQKLSLRRPLAILGAAVVGLAAVLTVSAPASAHHPVISGTACKITSGTDKGKYEVKWTVANSERDWDAVVENVTSPSRTAITNIVVGAKLPKLSSNKPALSGVQIVPANKDRHLTIKAFWDKPREDVTKTQTEKARDIGNCPTTPTSPTPTPTKPPTPTPSATTPTPTPPVTTPPSTPPATTPPATTPPASPTPTPPVVVPEPGEPTFELQETCDKLTFLIENPADGIAFTVTLTSEKGVVKELKAEPGKTTSVSFDAYAGLKVTPSAEGVTDETVAWTAPNDCGGAGGGSDDELALTGAAAGGIAGGAAVLLAIGVVLFLVFRRRRVRFTA